MHSARITDETCKTEANSEVNSQCSAIKSVCTWRQWSAHHEIRASRHGFLAYLRLNAPLLKTLVWYCCCTGENEGGDGDWSCVRSDERSCVCRDGHQESPRGWHWHTGLQRRPIGYDQVEESVGSRQRVARTIQWQVGLRDVVAFSVWQYLYGSYRGR